ncbi:MAG: hypothetical protein MZW92_32235 [Comamonadaceae bacterium]|nr:hypothetical protein [Comamonadaceae bacterium]
MIPLFLLGTFLMFARWTGSARCPWLIDARRAARHRLARACRRRPRPRS